MGAEIGAVGGHLRRDLGRVVVVVTVANSAVSWYFRWPGGPWRPLLGLSEHVSLGGDARIE